MNNNTAQSKLNFEKFLFLNNKLFNLIKDNYPNISNYFSNTTDTPQLIHSS